MKFCTSFYSKVYIFRSYRWILYYLKLYKYKEKYNNNIIKYNTIKQNNTNNVNINNIHLHMDERILDM